MNPKLGDPEAMKLEPPLDDEVEGEMDSRFDDEPEERIPDPEDCAFNPWSHY